MKLKIKGTGEKIVSRGLEKIDQILILGWGLIGDLFIRIPLIEALKDRFPGAEITVVVDPVCVAVLENHPACDHVIAFCRDKYPYIKYLMRYISQVMQMRRQHFDLCVNLYYGGSSVLISQLANARIRVCFDHTPALCRANNLMVPRPSFCNNWTLDLARMLVPLGIPLDTIRRGTSFYCSSASSVFAEKFLVGNSSSLIGINLGAGADEKRWPVDRFVELATKVNREHGLKPLVFTNPGMEQLADEFIASYTRYGDAIHVPLVSIDRVAGLMLHCDYVVTGDTALMHLAFGLKRPTLALFTCTRPETVEPEDVPHASCFVAGQDGTDICGNPMGTVDIPLDEAYRQFCNLIRSAKNAAASG